MTSSNETAIHCQLWIWVLVLRLSAWVKKNDNIRIELMGGRLLSGKVTITKRPWTFRVDIRSWRGIPLETSAVHSIRRKLEVGQWRNRTHTMIRSSLSCINLVNPSFVSTNSSAPSSFASFWRKSDPDTMMTVHVLTSLFGEWEKTTTLDPRAFANWIA